MIYDYELKFIPSTSKVLPETHPNFLLGDKKIFASNKYIR